MRKRHEAARPKAPVARRVRERRHLAGLTQAEFALKSGLGLRLFVRDLEQGKLALRLDKANQGRISVSWTGG